MVFTFRREELFEKEIPAKDGRTRQGEEVENSEQGSKVCDGPVIHQTKPGDLMVESMV